MPCLKSFFADFPGVPRRLVQGALLVRVAFDEVFDFAEDHFHHHRLRTGPAAPKPAKRGGENDDAGEKTPAVATAKMIMSCGQKIWPSTTNLRSGMFISSSGLPWMVTNGPANMMASSSQLNQVRQRKNRPLTLRGYIHLRRPDWSAVAMWSRKSDQLTAFTGDLAAVGCRFFRRFGRRYQVIIRHPCEWSG